MLLQSIWSLSCEIPERNQLQKDIQTDTAIIGAGLAGLLTAYRLREKGVETVVLEAGAVGSGQTKNTTAKITSQHGRVEFLILLNKNLVVHVLLICEWDYHISHTLSRLDRLSISGLENDSVVFTPTLVAIGISKSNFRTST